MKIAFRGRLKVLPLTDVEQAANDHPGFWRDEILEEIENGYFEKINPIIGQPGHYYLRPLERRHPPFCWKETSFACWKERASGFEHEIKVIEGLEVSGREVEALMELSRIRPLPPELERRLYFALHAREARDLYRSSRWQCKQIFQ